MNTDFTLVLDVETANEIDCAFTYDIGYQLIDNTGKIYASNSFCIRDIFVFERELVKSAYYAEKIPEYVANIREGHSRMIDFLQARKIILNVMKHFNCHRVAAYNASFDIRALNNTLRYLTKSKSRYFFPYDTEVICIWNMACKNICLTGEYKTFAELNRWYSNHGKNYKTSAEVVYAFLINNPSFEEAHKGLDDVKIETEIFLKCLENNNEMLGISRNCWMKVKRGALMPL